MESIRMQDLLAIATELFTEAYEGAGPDGSWFVTSRPDTGVFGTIAALDAAAASQPLRPGGPSVAAHVEHLRWTLALVDATLRGQPWQPDWAASWSVETVDETAWRELTASLRRDFERLRGTLAGSPTIPDPMALRGVLALAAHGAYHLGSIRQHPAAVRATAAEVS
jgi:hypothetical protein